MCCGTTKTHMVTESWTRFHLIPSATTLNSHTALGMQLMNYFRLFPVPEAETLVGQRVGGSEI